MPYRKVAEQALADWRAAERRMAAAEPESPVWQDAYMDSQMAKARYRQAVDDARKAGTPEPVPFEDAVRADEDADVTTITPPRSDGQMYGG